MRKDIVRRGLIYEVIMFLYATLITWMFIGNPLESLLLSTTVTITKIPLYYAFHHLWRAK